MSLIYRYYTFLHCIPETSIHLHFTMDSVLSGTWRTCFSPLCNHSIIKETRENVNHSRSFRLPILPLCYWITPFSLTRFALHKLMILISSTLPATVPVLPYSVLHSLLPEAVPECGYPAVYHATCFRISRIAVSSLLYFICRPAWRRIISFTSESSGFFGTVPCSRYSAVCAKIHGFPCAARPIITPSHPVSSRSAFCFLWWIHTSISSHRNGHSFFYFSDDFPVCFPE